MTEPSPAEVSENNFQPSYSLWQMVRYALGFGHLGSWRAGGLVGYMHRDLIEQRKWISEGTRLLNWLRCWRAVKALLKAIEGKGESDSHHLLWRNAIDALGEVHDSAK